MSHDTDDTIRPLLPLQVGSKTGHNANMVYDASGESSVLAVYGIAMHHSVDECRDDPGTPMAEFVVMACNSHHAMLEALNRTVAELDPEMGRNRIVELRESLLRLRNNVVDGKDVTA